jgi:N-acetylglucosaminyldiphosphoundecaprenol N-acetyl-beta-D-mannosaminyltransferase
MHSTFSQRVKFYKKLSGWHGVNAVDLIDECFRAPGVVTFTNPVNFFALVGENALVNKINTIYCDGILAVCLFSVISRRRLARFSFDYTSLAPVFFDYCREKKKTIYLIGSDFETINAFVSRVKEGNPNLKIIGFRDGYFPRNELDGIIGEIQHLKPDTVVCGIGCPLQEEVAVAISSVLKDCAVFTCGGFFHQHKNSSDYFPVWVNKYHLRMPYRFWKERHTRSRLRFYPRFFKVVLYDASIMAARFFRMSCDE